MMVVFRAERWQGNGWTAIDVKPVGSGLVGPLITFMVGAFDGQMPELVETLDGYMADFTLEGVAVMMLLDNWTFSFAFADEGLRDRVLAALEGLPGTYFGEHPAG